VGASGPLFGFSDTWQLVINTSTTIVTFLMVFLIQNTQNRDTEAMQIKLDELIRATQGAHNALLNLEHLEDEELERYRQHYAALAKRRAESCARASSTPIRPTSRTSGNGEPPELAHRSACAATCSGGTRAYCAPFRRSACCRRRNSR
jgi:low affinity Fe/Cu permease